MLVNRLSMYSQSNLGAKTILAVAWRPAFNQELYLKFEMNYIKYRKISSQINVYTIFNSDSINKIIIVLQ